MSVLSTALADLERRFCELEAKFAELEADDEDDDLGFVMPKPKVVDRLVSVKGTVARLRARANALDDEAEGAMPYFADICSHGAVALNDFADELER